MGLFNHTCSATNTPIKEGDKVALFIVKKNETENNTLFLLNKKTVSLPFFGEYNGYGNIIGFDENIYNNVGEELKYDISNDSYLIFMHEPAYHSIVNHNPLKAVNIWEHKSLIEDEFLNWSSMFKKHIINEDDSLSLKNAITNVNYTRRMLLLSSMEYLNSETERNEFISDSFYLLSKSYVKTNPEIIQNIFNSLFYDDKEQFLDLAQEYLNQMTLIRNMEKVNLNFDPKPYGKSEEDYELFQLLNNISVKICKKELKGDLNHGMF